MQGNDKLKHVGNKRKTEDREEMNSGLVTFAVLSRGIAWASLLLFRSFLLSGFLWSGFLWSSFLFALLLRRRLAALNYISTHFEFSFPLRIVLGPNPRNTSVGPVLN